MCDHLTIYHAAGAKRDALVLQLASANYCIGELVRIVAMNNFTQSKL